MTVLDSRVARGGRTCDVSKVLFGIISAFIHASESILKFQITLNVDTRFFSLTFWVKEC